MNNFIIYANKEHLVDDILFESKQTNSEIDVNTSTIGEFILSNDDDGEKNFYFIDLYDLKNRVMIFHKYRQEIQTKFNKDFDKIYYYNYNDSNRKSEELMFFEFLEDCGLGTYNQSENIHYSELLYNRGVYHLSYLYKKPPGYEDKNKDNKSVISYIYKFFGF